MKRYGSGTACSKRIIGMYVIAAMILAVGVLCITQRHGIRPTNDDVTRQQPVMTSNLNISEYLRH
jgi:hypothetical protein